MDFSKDSEDKLKIAKLEAYDEAIAVLQQARLGEIDTDLRSLISRIECLKKAAPAG